MEEFAAATVIMLFALAIGWVAVRHWYSKQIERLRALEPHLTDFDLLVDGSWLPRLPQTFLEGKLEGREVNLSWRNDARGQGGLFVAHGVRVENPPPEFEVSRAGLLKRVGRWMGVVKDVPTGDARVDRKYILAGREGSLAELFRNPEIEGALDALFEQGFDSIKLEEGQLVAECRTHQEVEEAAGTLAKLRSLARVAGLCERRAVTVTLLGPRQRFAWTGGGSQARCPYCRDDLDLSGGDLAACERCDTVHHAECFAEAEGCTIFGCASQRATPRAPEKA